VTRQAGYGPVQLASFLGLETWQFARARAAGLIPGPDRPRGRWSDQAAAEARSRIGDIVAGAGQIPDLGAWRAAEILSARLGVIVTADGVAELARRGLLASAGWYKDWPLYDGRAIEAFADPDAAEEASRAGQLRTADDAARHLGIRRADFGHLTRAGLLAPADWGRGPWDRRDQCSVPLYRTGDLDDLAARPGIDWAAVRATGRGRRSPLAALPSRPGGAR
jgi:hypothetical protein